MEKDALALSQDIAIDVDNVRKRFRSYQDKAASLKERFISPSRTRHRDVTVLDGISFQVRRGEAVGLIGKNGCGKSTTLKLLTRILYPNEGRVTVNGRVSSLIELGAGFHPDMTGRENIYTNASIFGLTRKEVARRMDAIIRFSELEGFIDSPVRTYSSGMYMRLAFAVAINVDADVLLIDEILAVGDAAFQRKCFERLKEIKGKGTTIVIVSHSMEQMYKICDRLIWIEDGAIREEGTPKFIGEAYLAAMEGRRLDRIEFEEQQKKAELEKRIREQQERLRKEQEEQHRKEAQEQEDRRRRDAARAQKEENERKRREELAEMKRRQKELERNETLKTVSPFCRPGSRRGGNGQCLISKIQVLDDGGQAVQVIETGAKYVIEVILDNPNRLKEVVLAVGFTREDGVYCYGTYTNVHEHKGKPEGAPIRFRFENQFLNGKYLLDFWVQSPEKVIYDEILGLMLLESKSADTKQRGIFNMWHEWE
ncbi:ABC transporter ATP-binding protein [uncultured Acetatifactor sp.]|uniref:ABC transporter ATP-binding protein n=1 Tax=uncultured Acetatifactor sp. TaxID=1671927 RepID=UPI00261A56C4|nr:ATP-binding cassette domain-containing protein [uncultured Acetatifactor sp.]